MKLTKLLPLAGVVAALAACSTLPPNAERIEPPPESVRPTAAAPERGGQLQPDLLYQMLVAEVAGQRGRLDVAADNYLWAAKRTRDARIARRATHIALYARDYATAMEAAKLWVELDPDDAEGRQSLAALLIRAGQTDAALEHLEHLLKLMPDDGERGFMVVSKLLSREQDTGRALAVMDKLVAKRPDDPNAVYAYAQLASAVGMADKALDLLERLFELQPEHAPGLVLKAHVLRQLGREDEAAEVYARALERNPRDTALRFSYARLLVDQKRFKEARENFRLLSQQLPNNADVIYALGLLALEAGDLEEAAKRFERLIQLGQRSMEAAFALGQLAEERKDWAGALRWYGAITEGINYLDAQIRMAAVMVQQGRVDEARAHLRGVPTEDEEERVRLFLAEAELLRDQAAYTEAMAVYNEALQRYPNHPELLYARAMTAERMDRIDILEHDLNTILEQDPDNVQALNALGYTLADRTERYEEAYGYIRQAYEKRPHDPAIVDSLGWVLYRLGRLEEAEKYLRQALEAHFDGEIAAHLGEVLWMQGRKDEARAIWHKALEREPEHRILKRVINRFEP